MLKRNSLYNAALLLAGIFLSLVIFESALRLGLIRNMLHEIMSYDGERKNPRQKILILGDSFITKWHTGDSPYDLLLKDFEEYDAQILNAARSGMGPLDYLSEMKTRGVAFKPDVTLLFYYAGNDLTDVQYAGQNAQRIKSRIRDFLRPILKKFYIYHFFREKMDSLAPSFFDYETMERAGIDREMIDLARRGKMNFWLLMMSLRHKNYLLDNVLMETNENMLAWGKTKKTLSEINALCKKINSQLAIIIFPRSVQINDAQFPFFEKCGFALDERMPYSDKPQRLLKEFCLEQNIPCLDILPYFKAAADKQLYLDIDDHFNTAGCRLSARLICDFIAKYSKLKK